jgi:hypothetical protein
MCDYSLQSVTSRPAKVGEKLITYNFGTGTIGFSGVNELDNDNPDMVAVCVLPGTEIAFEKPVECHISPAFRDKVARFRQIDKEFTHRHHDALEFPDGEIVCLTNLRWGQRSTVLQLPAAPQNEAEEKEQTRVAVNA